MFFMNDEAWFHLSGYVNSQNSRYWGTENPHNCTSNTYMTKRSMCGASATRIIGPIFFDPTVNMDVYLAILEEFYSQLTEQECEYCFFQQDGATSHTSERSLARVHEMFTAERTVSKGLWPLRSPDLLTCDFYLWGYLKGKVYEQNPHNIEELNNNIKNSIHSITTTELTRVRRAQECLDADGGQFHYLL
jgi:hypothetical protein